MPNPFNLRNPGEKEADLKALADRIVQSTEDYNLAIDKAKRCLEHEAFKHYVKDYEVMVVTLFELMMDLPLQEPTLFAFQIESIRCKIKALRALGVQVNEIASLKPRPMPTPIKKEGEK